VGEGDGIEPALPDEAGPLAFHDHLDLVERHGPAEGLAERLLGREPRCQPLRGEPGGGKGVGEFSFGEQAPQPGNPVPLDESGDAVYLHEVHA